MKQRSIASSQFTRFQTARAQLAKLEPNDTRLKGGFQLRTLRARWRKAKIRPGSKRPMLRNNVDADEGFCASDKLIDWTMQEVQDFAHDRNGQNERSHAVSVTLPELFDTIEAIISSSSTPTNKEHWSPLVEQTPAPLPSIELQDRSRVAANDLQTAIKDAVKKSVSGCETFAGVIVNKTTPKSRFDANWALKGVKFGRANREKADKVLKIIVDRMQREFYLDDD